MQWQLVHINASLFAVQVGWWVHLIYGSSDYVAHLILQYILPMDYSKKHFFLDEEMDRISTKRPEASTN